MGRPGRVSGGDLAGLVFVSGEVMREVRDRESETAYGKNSENVAFEWGEKLHFVEPKTAKSYIL